MTLIASTTDEITRYQMIVVKHGLKACERGMRVNRDYTPTNLRKMVEKWTQKKFKARDYTGMIKAVEELIAGTQEEANV